MSKNFIKIFTENNFIFINDENKIIFSTTRSVSYTQTRSGCVVGRSVSQTNYLQIFIL